VTAAVTDALPEDTRSLEGVARSVEALANVNR
jgi:hypothetical protein